MAATVQRDAAKAFALEGAIPAKPAPVFPRVRREAVNEDHAGPVRPPDIIIGERHAAAFETRHPSPPLEHGRALLEEALDAFAVVLGLEQAIDRLDGPAADLARIAVGRTA